MLPCLAAHEHEQKTETNCILTVYTGKDKTRDDVRNESFHLLGLTSVTLARTLHLRKTKPT